ncbi:MAG: hypothetical protein KTR30_19535 [Saprospiraceae bacterium]|nr:hypothetical protein [Saprospiraceae bacterium]
MRQLQSFLVIPLLVFSFLVTSIQAQTDEAMEETGYAGDHFSLEGALSLFKAAKSMEDFEKALNKESNQVNNLDLNEDGDIDYIRVIDHMDGDAHAIVLQVPVSETESQDLAVIEIEKTGAENAILQIIGDEEVFGESKIVEPFDVEADDSQGRGPGDIIAFKRVVVNVWFWPSVRFVYGPRYRVWVSPFSWRVYPRGWRPRRPRPFSTFYVGLRPYRTSFRVVNTHRVVRAHNVYVPRRRTSTTVVRKTTVVRNSKGGTAVRRTTTTTRKAQGAGGAKAAKRTTTSTTKVRGRNGGTATKRTTTRAAGAKTKNGAAVGKRRTTTTTKAKSRNGKTAGKKRTTTVRKKRKN